MNIAIIGAGLSGSTLFNLLSKKHNVTIFEKSRGAGGRCSTKYIEDKKIDHGTPFFKTYNKEFETFCQDKVKEEIVYKKDDTYYPKDGINKLCSSLIDKSYLKRNSKIISCVYEGNKWELKDENNNSYKGFDKLILTIPAPQILQLDINLNQKIKEKLSKVTYSSVATLILYSNFSKNILDKNILKSSIFEKVVNNSLKYDYEDFSSYVLHLNKKVFKEKNFQNKDEIYKFFLEKSYEISKINLEDNFTIIPHLWKYALVENNIVDEYCLYDEKISLGICGDYFKYKNLDGAFISAKKLFEAIVK